MLAYLSLIPLIKFQHKSAGILLIYSNKSGERIILCFFIFSVYICTCSIRSASISLDGTAMVIENIMQIILYWIESAMCMLCGCVDHYDVMHIMFAWHFLLAFFVLLLPPHFAYAYDWTEWHIIAAKMIKEEKKWQGEQKERRLAHIWGKRLFHLHLQAIYFYEMNWHAKHSVVTWNENRSQCTLHSIRMHAAVGITHT